MIFLSWEYIWADWMLLDCPTGRRVTGYMGCLLAPADWWDWGLEEWSYDSTKRTMRKLEIIHARIDAGLDAPR